MGKFKIQACGPEHYNFERVRQDLTKHPDNLYRPLKKGSARYFSNMLSKMKAEKLAKISQGICRDSNIGENRYAPGVVEEIRQFQEGENSSALKAALYGFGVGAALLLLKDEISGSGGNSGKGGGGGNSKTSSSPKESSRNRDSAYRVRALREQITWRPEPFSPHQDTGWSWEIGASDTLPLLGIVGLTVVTLGAAAGLTAAGAGLLFAAA